MKTVRQYGRRSQCIADRNGAESGGTRACRRSAARGVGRAPDDNQLLRLAAKQRRQAERFARVYSLLKETTEAIEADEFVRAVGAYREAVNLSQGFSSVLSRPRLKAV